MVRTRLAVLLALAGVLCLSGPALAQSPIAGEAAVQGQPAPAPRAKAKKPAPQNAKSEGLSLPSSLGGGSQRSAGDTQTQRRIDLDDIADPFGGGIRGGSRSDVKPMMTPSGRAGIGGRF